jgi:hypothetical protein
LLFYGYATGVFSARRIEKATYESLYLLNNLGMTACAQASCHGRGKRA